VAVEDSLARSHLTESFTVIKPRVVKKKMTKKFISKMLTTNMIACESTAQEGFYIN